MAHKRSGFTLIELLVVISIIGILSSIGLNTFTSAQKKSRDTKRKAHLKQIADALQAYSNDNLNNQYPADGSDSGLIYGCGSLAAEACTWGSSAFSNTDTNTVYMAQLPADPSLGSTYYYDSQTVSGYIRNFTLCARLENTLDIAIPKDAGNNPLVYTNTDCSSDTCNYCITSPNLAPPTTEADN